jgi:hypothetical protein
MTASLVDQRVCREPEPVPVDLATVRAFERGEIVLHSTRPHRQRHTYAVPCPDGRCPTRSIFLVESEREFEHRLAQHYDEVRHPAP